MISLVPIVLYLVTTTRCVIGNEIPFDIVAVESKTCPDGEICSPSPQWNTAVVDDEEAVTPTLIYYSIWIDVASYDYEMAAEATGNVDDDAIPITTNTTIRLYNIHLLTLWGQRWPQPTALCDSNGNAQFFYDTSTRLTIEESRLVATNLSSFNSSALEVRGMVAFRDRLNASSDSGNVVEEAFTLALAICRLHPGRIGTNATINIWGKFNSYYTHGALDPGAWQEMLFQSLLLIPRFWLVIWFWRRCRSFNWDILMQQRVYLYCVAQSAAICFSYVVFLANANNTTGQTVSTSLPLETILFQTLVWSANFQFCLLLLLTAKGWGVVYPTLRVDTIRHVTVFFCVALTVYVVRHVVQPGASLLWVTVGLDTFLINWIYKSLIKTEKDLLLPTWNLSATTTTTDMEEEEEDLTRSPSAATVTMVTQQQQPSSLLSSYSGLMTEDTTPSSLRDSSEKLTMYIHLQELIVFSFGTFLLGCFLIFLVVFCVWKVEHRYVAYTVPAAVSFVVNACILIIEIGFAVLWAPSTRTAMYVYSTVAPRRRESSRRAARVAMEDVDDPTRSFGRIDTV